ncbi:hypothetical protein ACNZ7R_01700 [Enterobacter hormaechei]
MDSIAIAWWKRPDIALTLDYGQQAANAEIKAATATCEALEWSITLYALTAVRWDQGIWLVPLWIRMHHRAIGGRIVTRCSSRWRP